MLKRSEPSPTGLGLFPDLRLDLSQLNVAEWDRALDLVSLTDFIHAACQTIIGASPDQMELARLHDLGEASDGREAVIGELMRHPNFRARYSRRALATMSLESFIRQTYADILGRSPDADGMHTYTRMGRKWRGRQRVLSAVSRSPEGVAGQSGRLGRIAVLRRRLWLSRIGHLPIVGRWILAVRTHLRRMHRVELIVAAQMSVPAQFTQGNELVRQIAECLSQTGTARDEPEFEGLASGSSRAEVQHWMFREAVTRARRASSVRSAS